MLEHRDCARRNTLLFIKLSSDSVIEFVLPLTTCRKLSPLPQMRRGGGVFGWDGSPATDNRCRGRAQELFSQVAGQLQIRNVQRRSWRERGWRRLGATMGSDDRRLTKQPAQSKRSAGKTTMGSMAGAMTWIRSPAGGARFTGVSASLKAVSGKSGRGTAETQTAAANRTRTKAQRSRCTAHFPKRLKT